MGCFWAALATLGRAHAQAHTHRQGAHTHTHTHTDKMRISTRTHTDQNSSNNRCPKWAFWTPRMLPNGTQIGTKNDQKSMRKTNQEKNQNKTSIAPSKTQAPLTNIRKINNNQKITDALFDRFEFQQLSKMEPQNNPKSINESKHEKKEKERDN